MNIKKSIFLLSSAVALMLSAGDSVLHAQDYDSFYRGRNASRYTYRYNGNFYWDNQQFHEGELWYDGKLFTGMSLNINAHLMRVLLMRNGDVVPNELETAKVSWFTMDDRLFVNLQSMGYNDASEGFYELLWDGGGDVLLSRVDKLLKHDTKEANGETIGYYDPNYNSKIARYFERAEDCWVIHDGQLYRVHSKADFRKLYKSRRSEVRRIARMYSLNLPNVTAKRYCIAQMTGLFEDGSSSAQSFSLNMPRPSASESSSWVDNLPGLNLPSSGILPPGWFSAKSEEDSLVRYVSGAVIVATHQNKVYEIGDRNAPSKGLVRVSGFVFNDNTGESIPGVVVSDNVSGVYTTTAKDGSYSIDIPLGEDVLNFSEYSMDDFHVMVNAYSAARLDVRMNEKSTLLESALVSAESRANHRTAKMGLEKMSMNTMRKIPAAFGEGDVLKAMQSLPGVSSVGEASSGINVRGGSVDQNLILFNGSTIFNPSHMFGIFSSFNPDVVDGVELYKASIPAEYGGRISSVLDVKGKDGDFEKFKGSLGLGLLTSHLTLEGPIVKGKTSFILGGRTTYSDWLLKNLPSNSSYSGGSANFSDLNAGITHRFAPGNTLQGSFYWSHDKFNFSSDTLFNYSSVNASLIWKKEFSDALSMKVSGAYDRYGSELVQDSDPVNAYSYSTAIQQFDTKAGLYMKAGAHALSAGVQEIVYMMQPGSMSAMCDESLVESRTMAGESALESSLWVGDEIDLGALSFDLGGRLAMFKPFGNGGLKFYPEARVSAKYTVNTDLSFKAAFTNTTQFIHLISNTSSVSPVDTWKLSDSSINPQRGWQAATGAYWTVFDGKLDLSLEGYWKQIRDYLDYKSGAVLIMNDNLADDLVPVNGKSYGVEFMARKTSGALTGQLSYTWSRAMLRDISAYKPTAINEGRWYDAPFDKPHNFKFEGNYAFTRRYSLSCNIDYSTGRPVTIPMGRYMYGGTYRLAYSDRNAYRIPDYFRMDLAFNIDPGHKLTKLTHFTWTMGVYNVTGRKNAYSVYYTTNGSSVRGYLLSVFATQIPYLSLNMRF